MRIFKNVFSKLYVFLIWIIFSTMIWGWIFNLVTDTTVDKKVTLFIEAPVLQDTELAVYLEEDMPEGIKMIKVHPFSYAMINADLLLGSDLFIVRESNIEQYAEDLAPIDPSLYDGDSEIYYIDSVAYGIKVYDHATKSGLAAEYIEYYDEDCYLFFGADSTHISDGAALRVAERLLELK